MQAPASRCTTSICTFSAGECLAGRPGRDKEPQLQGSSLRNVTSLEGMSYALSKKKFHFLDCDFFRHLDALDMFNGSCGNQLGPTISRSISCAAGARLYGCERAGFSWCGGPEWSDIADNGRYFSFAAGKQSGRDCQQAHTHIERLCNHLIASPVPAQFPYYWQREPREDSEPKSIDRCAGAESIDA